MASWVRRAMDAEEQLRELREKAEPVQRLISHSLLVESALAVLMKHNLLGDFAAELSMRRDTLRAEADAFTTAEGEAA